MYTASGGAFGEGLRLQVMTQTIVNTELINLVELQKNRGTAIEIGRTAESETLSNKP